MVVSIENMAIGESMKDTLERTKIARSMSKKPNLARFFGVLPEFEDGMEFQKKARNEWN